MDVFPQKSIRPTKIVYQGSIILAADKVLVFLLKCKGKKFDNVEYQRLEILSVVSALWSPLKTTAATTIKKALQKYPVAVISHCGCRYNLCDSKQSLEKTKFRV